MLLHALPVTVDTGSLKKQVKLCEGAAPSFKFTQFMKNMTANAMLSHSLKLSFSYLRVQVSSYNLVLERVKLKFLR